MIPFDALGRTYATWIETALFFLTNVCCLNLYRFGVDRDCFCSYTERGMSNKRESTVHDGYVLE